MQFTSFTTFFSLFFFSHIISIAASPLALDKRDVFVPPITYPHENTVWIVGDKHTVTWDISDRPVNITNNSGRIMLRKADLTTPLILADKFDILLGRISVRVPWVEVSDDYCLVLFGDSGNFSPQFTIQSA